jgi:hypothetical protein
MPDWSMPWWDSAFRPASAWSGLRATQTEMDATNGTQSDRGELGIPDVTTLASILMLMFPKELEFIFAPAPTSRAERFCSL